jgi:hypothetical protein
MMSGPKGRPWEVRYWDPKNWPVFDDKGSIIALVHHVTDATAAVLMSKADASFPMGPPTRFADPLQRADRAILQARQTVRETQEAILRLSAQMEYVVSGRPLNPK